MRRRLTSWRAIVPAALAAILAATSPASAMFVVFSDVNSMDSTSAPRDAILTNLLGGGDSVLVSDKVSGYPSGSVFSTFYDGLDGVAATLRSDELGASDLVGVDLLFLNLACCSPSAANYSATETAAFVAFEQAGGTVAILAEPCCGGDMDGVNDFLAELGTGLSLATHSMSSGVATLADDPLMAGATGYAPSTFNPILGGTALATVDGLSAISGSGGATSSPVPAPAALPLLAGALGLLGLAARRARA
ncbi:hypothetical protein [Albimonas pacifica]|uniref:VPLPA-CTERM protein sorting domain-containing protein n=1 Tax=Albimonas pacifica TaxID=1114924 RepID=A0A1I3MET2_9RHOB|nr:hypothetical protein [Albimonas pacifica]SFI95478.1 hypothetical protein SAMN05216258_11173 [Albimonas pacifica]